MPSGDDTVFVQVLRHPAEAGERDRDRLYAIRDQWPVDDTYPTLSWVPGEEIADHYRLTLDPATPPGRYRLLVGLYDRATGRRLPVRGDALPLAEFRVAPESGRLGRSSRIFSVRLAQPARRSPGAGRAVQRGMSACSGGPAEETRLSSSLIL